MNYGALFNYVASVAFAIAAAFLIGGKGAALACMFAWAAAYAGMYACMLEGAKDERANFIHGIAVGLTLIAAVLMFGAYIQWVYD